MVLFAVQGLILPYYDVFVAVLGPDQVFEFALLFCLSFFAGTYLLLPDLDLRDSDPAKSWGIVQVIWRPYARVFKHHGFSRTPVLGTLSRVVYLGSICYVISAVIQSLMDLDWAISVYDFPWLLSPRSLCVFLGLAASDLVHLVADQFFSR